MSAFFGPTSTQRRYVDVGREQFLKPRVAIAGNGADRRSLNEEYCAAPGKKGSYLAPLNSADFHLIGAYGKDGRDRKSTRLNSSHVSISYAVFCLKKKKSKQKQER